MRCLLIIFLLISPTILGESFIENIDLYLYIEKPTTIIYNDGLNEYRLILGKWESNNIDTLPDIRGYRGRYQFCKSTAEGLGVSYDSLHIKKWSDIALDKLMKENWYLLGSYYTYKNKKWSKTKDYHNYVGKTIAGIKITKAGMLAAAHLKGWTYVKIFLDSNGELDGWDGNKMHVSTYLKIMENVKLNT